MKKTLMVWLSLLLTLSIKGQTMIEVTGLASGLQECSGLLVLNGQLITINDSGGAAALYEVDTVSGEISRTVTVSNATNTDWESLSKDDDYIYIGDFGNNYGNRTDLRFYRISINDYLTTANDTVVADTIGFVYDDQTDFTSTVFSTNFDAEACILNEDSLYIFTKNWSNYYTNIYVLPASQGNHIAKRVDSLNVQGLITGMSLDANQQDLILVGYTYSPFLVKLSMVDWPHFDLAPLTRIDLNTSGSIQIEGVASVGGDINYIIAESHVSGQGILYRVHGIETLDGLVADVTPMVIYPNPAKNQLTFKANELAAVKLFDLEGHLILTTNQAKVDVSCFTPGMYIACIYTHVDSEPIIKPIIIE